MSIPRPLVECIVGSIALLEFSSDSEIDPAFAARGLEDIVSCLADLTADEQTEFLSLCAEVSGGYQGIARAKIPSIIADSLGLECP